MQLGRKVAPLPIKWRGQIIFLGFLRHQIEFAIFEQNKLLRMPQLRDVQSLNILLLDDHEIFCQGLQLVFSTANPSIQFSYCTQVEDAKALLKEKRFDVLLSDIHLPDTNTQELIQYCREQYAGMYIIIISSVMDMVTIKQYFNYGIHGFVSKTAGYKELEQAMEKIFKGALYISPDLNNQLVHQFFAEKSSILTPKELETIKLIAKGKSVAQIAQLLNISLHTVMSHRRNMMKKLNLHSGVELAQYAYKNNLV